MAKILGFEFRKKTAEEKRQEMIIKYNQIRMQIIRFYNHLDQSTGETVTIPAFVRADNKLKEIIQSEKDINFYWRILKKYRMVGA